MNAIPASAQRAVRGAAPWLERLARLGFLAKALLYMTVGALATCAALRLVGTAAPARGGTVGTRGAMGALLSAPAGRALLFVIAAGMLGYAVWRTIDAIFDPERHRSGLPAIGSRLRSAGVALVHFGLAYSAVRIAMGHFSAARDGEQSQHWTARALATPGGGIALLILALVLFGYGVYQLSCAWRAKLDKSLAIDGVSPSINSLLVSISRFGIAARGVVFGVTGVLVARAVRDHNPADAAGPQRSLRQLVELGAAPFAVIAVGLIAYGVYQLINARYRRIVITEC